jgi:signal transduction histidine kinase
LSRWIESHRNGVIDMAWMVFSLASLDFIVMFPGWETIPFHFIWISLTLIYGFRTWKLGPTLWVLGVVMLLTTVGIGVAVRRGAEPPAELFEVPLMAAVFLAMVWHARRRLTAEHSYQLIAAQIARILTDQRRFLQDAAHQLRTPITIALGHAELLADVLASDQQEGEDIAVVMGELNRLRRISERLLLIAAAADPAFLHPEPVALDELVTELVRRWRPAADRHWRTGTLDSVTVPADRERLSLALDALIENAVRHTSSDDAIQLAVIGGAPDGPTRLVVTDTGTGIAIDQLPFIFDRFNTGGNGWSQGTGLGLPLVTAVATAHGGTVNVRSEPGEGSEFELLLPIADELPRLPVGSDCLPGRRGGHQPQVGGQLGRGHHPQHMSHYLMPGVQEERLRQRVYAIRASRAHVRVERERVGDPLCAGELQPAHRGVVLVEAEQDDAAMVSVPAGQQRGLLLARLAPGGPEVHDDRLARVLAQGDLPARLAEGAERERGRGPVARGAAGASSNADRDHHGDEYHDGRGDHLVPPGKPDRPPGRARHTQHAHHLALPLAFSSADAARCGVAGATSPASRSASASTPEVLRGQRPFKREFWHLLTNTIKARAAR